jgi:hypothetical protein
MIVALVIQLVILIVVIAGVWKVYEKAGEPGWACIVPIYNAIVFLRIVGRPWWWIFLLLVPLLNLVIAIMCTIDLARYFGKGGGFAVGLILLGFIFYPILGFGDAEYEGPGEGARRKKKKRRLDDEDEEEEDEDFEDDRPPRKKKPARDEDLEDEEEEERPRRKEAIKKASRDRDYEDEDEEEEEAPRPKSSGIKKPAPAPAKPAAGEPTVVECENCNRKLRVPPTAIGKKIKCPGCGSVFVA